MGNYAGCNGEFLGAPASNDSMLRVCKGVNACDYKDAIASVDDACRRSEPEITFDCPESGTYAVMSAAKRGRPDGIIGSTIIDTSYNPSSLYPCAHDALSTGNALNPACSVCVAEVCDRDSTCCSNQWTAGCVAIASSTSRALVFSPLRMMMSLRRPVMRR